MARRYIRNVIVILVAAILAISVAFVWRSAPKRVNRKHVSTVSKEFEYLTHRLDLSPEVDTRLGRKDAEKDLDELEWLLENRFSYLKRKGVDYRAALDSIRSSLGNEIRRSELGLQLMKFIALFGDGHSGVGDPGLGRMCSGYLPFLVGQSNGRFVGFKADRSGYLHEECPFLRSVDGMALEEWLRIAERIAAKGSAQLVCHQNIKNLRYIQYLRKEMGLSLSDEVQVELESEDGQTRRTLSLPITEEYPLYGPWPHRDSQILSENIGYLRITPWMSDKPEFLDELVSYMKQFRDTDGLIIDIRGIGGGSRAPLRVLFPFFMADGEPPRVLNVAAYRKGHRKDILDARWLYPKDWEGWSIAERVAIRKCAETFEPEWRPPGKEFSEWHYFVLGPSRGDGSYHYDKPVVILMETQNFSASDIFLGAFKGWKNITLMGTPSSGGSGRYQNYRFHYSHIKVGFSSMASFRPTGKLYEGNGIQPDVYIEPVPTDFIGRTDTILDAAIQRLSSKSEQVRTDVNLRARRNWFDSLSG